MTPLLLAMASACCPLFAAAAPAPAPGDPPLLAATALLRVDLRQEPQLFPHYWTRCFGSGHALMGTRADWQQQLRR